MAAPMPRDPPVTSATLPSSEQKPLSGSGERLLELAQRVGIADGERRQRAVAAAQEAAQHLARSDLHEHADAVAHEGADGLRELHGTGELLDEQAREALRGLD